MTPPEYRAYRLALTTGVHHLVLALERRGVRFRLDERGVVQAAPVAQITVDELAALRAHRDAVRLLVRYRDHWCEWPLVVQPFDPSSAFGPAEVH